MNSTQTKPMKRSFDEIKTSINEKQEKERSKTLKVSEHENNEGIDSFTVNELHLRPFFNSNVDKHCDESNIRSELICDEFNVIEDHKREDQTVPQNNQCSQLSSHWSQSSVNSLNSSQLSYYSISSHNREDIPECAQSHQIVPQNWTPEE